MNVDLTDLATVTDPEAAAWLAELNTHVAVRRAVVNSWEPSPLPARSLPALSGLSERGCRQLGGGGTPTDLYTTLGQIVALSAGGLVVPALVAWGLLKGVR